MPIDHELLLESKMSEWITISVCNLIEYFQGELESEVYTLELQKEMRYCMNQLINLNEKYGYYKDDIKGEQ